MKAEEEDHEEKEKEGKQDSKQTQEEEAEMEEEEDVPQKAYGALLCLFLTIDNTQCVCRVFIFKDTSPWGPAPSHHHHGAELCF